MPAEPDSLGPGTVANVARLAAERGLSVEELAERAGVDPAFLAPGGKRLGVRRVRALATALGVDPQDIVRDPSERCPPPAAPRGSLAAAITRNVARLAASRGLTVEGVEKQAGMRPGFLSPVDGSKLRVTGIAAVADVLGVEVGDIMDAAGYRLDA